MMLPLRTENLRAALAATLEEIPHSGLFLLTDSNVATHVLPKILNVLTDKEEARIIEIPAGEDNKNLDTLTRVWSNLSEGGATRNSLLINLGGGVVTDLGGFAAASFKRGIRFVNIPTTILGAVDAAVGGKTGIDFNGLKNEIGAFANAECVIISSEPLATLPRGEILSGLGEIVKTAMISSGELYQKVLDDRILSDMNLLQDAMAECVRFKARVTEEDPHESGLRKILNFGHTAGHAFESLMLTRHTPVTHGCAVANGILVALILSHMHLSLPSDQIYLYKDRILQHYFPPIPFTCKDYDKLAEIISHDKKNSASSDWKFVLLSAIGTPHRDISVSKEDLFTALDIYKDLTGI